MKEVCDVLFPGTNCFINFAISPKENTSVSISCSLIVCILTFYSCCEYHESHEDSPRKQRLDAIRRIFLSTYSSLLDLHHNNGLGGSTTDGNSTGIGGLLENFAEKVGFRIPRSTAV